MSTYIFAQNPISSFAISDNSGCSPHTVSFTDQSSNASSWSWTFGNGNISTNQNPSAVYTIPGTYTVTLTVYNGVLSNSSSQTITVFSNPHANFEAVETIYCTPFNTNFHDLSVQGDGTLTQWTWDFGDGYSSSSQNPSHIFQDEGLYTITLQVIDENGCNADTFFSNFITVTEKPVINISASETFSCEPPLDVQFTNNSTAYGNVTYAWDLGNGETSTIAAPSSSYDVTGQYDVSFSITDENGCFADTILIDYINVTNVVADFDIPDTICRGVAYTFLNTSVGGATYSWNFGDGATSTSVNPSHLYNISGDISVTLISTESFQCKDTIIKSIYVEQAIASYTYSPASWCQAPVDVTFTNSSSSNIVSWLYSFGDGQTGSNSDDVHEYIAGGVYLPTLIVESTHGCRDTSSSGSVVIIPFAVSISADTNRSCLPLPIEFTETNTSVQQIVNWSWDFGDGGTSTDSMPTYTYNDDGDFYAVLTVENEIGCVGVSDPLLIEVGDSLIPQAQIDSIITCAIDEITFTDISDSTDLIDEWWWYYGEGEGEGSTAEATHLYQDTTGYFDIQFVIGYNGCYSDTLKDSVLILGPIVKLDVAMECDSPFVYTFTLDITDATDFTLDFRDGTDTVFSFENDTSMLIEITHTYDSLLHGTDFYVVLSAFNDTVNEPDGCEYFDSLQVYIRDIIADFIISDTLPCANESVTFTSTSQDASSYFWQAHNHTTGVNSSIYSGTLSTANYTFNTNAYFDINFIATDYNGCKDTISKWLKTYRPIVNFAADSLIGCTPLLMNFYDTTASDTALINWEWKVNTVTFLSGDEDTVSYNLNQIQNYTIRLIVTDTLGCSNYKDLAITSTKPKPHFSISDLQLCAGDSVSFTNSSTGHGILSYEWYFDDGDSAFVTTPYHTYVDSGYFHVSLLAIDDIGCDSLVYYNDSIHVQAIPDAAFVADTTVWDCYYNVHNFQFTDTTESVYVNSYLWYFGDGSSSNVPNPSHIYNLPGDYSVQLSVETTYGCKDTTLKAGYIEVNGPLGVGVFPTTLCRGDSIMFLVQDTFDVFSFDWDFGDGYLIENSEDTTHHIYNIMGQLMPTLILHSDTMGTCDVPVQASLYIHELTANFSGEQNGCIEQHSVNLDDQSTSVADNVVAWNWDFGNGTSSSLENPPIFSYNDVDTFDVTLIVQNEFGCHDTVDKEIIIYPLPILTIREDTLICLGSEVQLWATGGIDYQWSPNYNLSNNLIYNPIANPQIETTYSVLVTDTNSCYASENVHITVQQPLNLELDVMYMGEVIDGEEITIILGDTIFFNAITADTAVVSWSPNEHISCIDCISPYANPYASIQYTVLIIDPNGCNFEVSESIQVNVTEATLDVPSAFTPNGDNNNDVLYAKGWGLEKLLEFKIFNRWGQLVFETAEINEGWDGTFNGKLQNIDTYVFMVKGEAYNGDVLFKKGYVNLME
ncbi:MAG: hypothetical protein A2W98_09740 [Bacteroidetes bacterium GWF2_33_38]|nr:MAG: hypothetical protein A2W98_09740 [Bacteroidetes bacterium GWF2_33_38]OFY75078.1 MAG: hypothetical protein A2265_06210 [Bacteroidetes bacterium RIFOXYA12_FULL_33_9]